MQEKRNHANPEIRLVQLPYRVLGELVFLAGLVVGMVAGPIGFPGSWIHQTVLMFLCCAPGGLLSGLRRELIFEECVDDVLVSGFFGGILPARRRIRFKVMTLRWEDCRRRFQSTAEWTLRIGCGGEHGAHDVPYVRCNEGELIRLRKMGSGPDQSVITAGHPDFLVDPGPKRPG